MTIAPPAPSRRASTVLASFALACGFLSPVIVGTLGVLSIFVNRAAWAMGMPNADDYVFTYVLAWARAGAVPALVIAIIGLALLMLAHTRTVRARIWLLVAAWVMIAFSFITIGVLYAVGYVFGI